MEHMKPLFKSRLLQNPALQGNEEGVNNMTSSKAENMRATIDMVRTVYGSAEKYITEVVCLSEEQVMRLRKNLISNEKPML